MVKIEIIDSVWTKICPEAQKHLHPVLQYDHFYWMKTAYGSEKVVQKHFMIEEHADGFFILTGLVPRAVKALRKKRVKYELISNLEDVECYEPVIKGYEFRDYQKKLIDAALDHGRGILVAPTGTGKSIVLLGITAAYKDDNILFLVHTKDLMNQMKVDFEKAFPNEEIGEWSAKKKSIQRITVATVQSYIKVAIEYCDFFKVILIDEVHHVSGLETQYAQVLMRSSAHTKLGLTATKRPDNKGQWAAEALLGPVLAEYTMNEAQDDNILATPTIHLYESPAFDIPIKYTQYEDKYDIGIVCNQIRNHKVVEVAGKFVKQRKVVLITVTSIDHGERIKKIFEEEGVSVEFIYGKSSTEERERIKNGLKDRSIKCAIASVIFLEGINIPTLDVVINASAGVSPIQTVQRIGRALRKTEDKDSAILVDFMDNTSGTLKRQSEKRIRTYESKGWKVVHMDKRRN